MEHTFNKRTFFLLGLLTLCVPLFAAEPPAERIIHVTVAASANFQGSLDWKKEVQERLSLANRIFEKDFSIRFVIANFATWEPQDEKRAMSLLIEELSGKFPVGQDEIVIGFHRMTQDYSGQLEEDADTVGTAAFFRGIIVIRDPAKELPPLSRRVILAHEICHLYGAVHIAANKAIMQPVLPRNPALQLDSDNLEILRLTSKVDFRTGIASLPPASIDGLIEHYERLIRANPKNDFYYQLGLFYRQRGQDARAVSTWEEAVRFHYDDPYIHRELGYHYFTTARYDMAIQELGSAVAHFILPSQKADRVKSYNLLGMAYYYRGSVDQAVFNWLQGLAANPDDIWLQMNLATAYLAKGDIERGVNELEKLLAKNPSSATILSNLASAYLQKGDAAKAVEYYQSALAKLAVVSKDKLTLEVSEVALRTNLGAAYLDLGELDESMQEFQKAILLPGAGYEAHRGLAQVYTRKKDYPKAIEEIQKAQTFKPDDPYLYSWLAEAYHAVGKLPEAMKAAQAGIPYAQGVLKANLYKNVGFLYFQEKDYKNAEAQFKSALNLDWNDAETHTQIAAVYANQGKMEDAERSVQTALHMKPAFEPAQKMLLQMKSVGAKQKNR